MVFHPYIFTKNFLKNLWKESIVFKWFLSNFNRFYYSDFLFLYIYEKFLKNLWKQNILFQTILLLGFSLLKDLQKFFEKFMETKYCVSNYFVAWIFPSYIFTKLFWKIYGYKILYSKLFCYSDFPSLYIFTKNFWKIYEDKILYLGGFWVIFNLFWQLDLPFLYIYKRCLKNLWKKNCILSYFVTQIFTSYIYLRKFFEKFTETKYCI